MTTFAKILMAVELLACLVLIVGGVIQLFIPGPVLVLKLIVLVVSIAAGGIFGGCTIDLWKRVQQEDEDDN